MESLEFLKSSGGVGIDLVFSSGTDVLLWTCHGVEQWGKLPDDGPCLSCGDARGNCSQVL